MLICNKKHTITTPGDAENIPVYRRVRRIFLVVALFSLHAGTILTCNNGNGGPTTPSQHGDSPFAGVSGRLDKRLFGLWTRSDTTTGRETVSFGTDSAVRIEQFNDDPKYGGQPFRYKTGYWAVSLDTLLLSYVEFLFTGFGYLPVDTVKEYTFNFRITDEYQLGLKTADSLSKEFKNWQFYSSEGDHPFQGVLRDSSRLNVVARVDTLYFPDDTARFEAFAFGPDTTGVRYIWSSPEDGVNRDITTKGTYAKYFPLQTNRKHEWSVRAVNSKGELSEPDYFAFDLPLFPPFVRMNDTTLICGRPISIPIVAGDTNGTVEMYYWQLSNSSFGTGYRDSSPEPFVTLADTCLFSEKVTVTVRDNHKLRSAAAEFRLRVYPVKTIGSERNETPVALCETSSGELVIVGRSAREATLTSASYVVKVSPDGAFMKADTFRVGHYLGGYGYNLPQSIIEGPDQQLIIVGALDDSYSHTDSGFVVALDHQLGVVWAKSLRDAGAKGALLAAAVVVDDGTIRVGGYSSTDSCTSEQTGSGTVMSCRYIWNPYVAAMDGSGNLLWQTTYHSHTVDYRQNMLKTPEYIIFSSGSFVMNIDQEATVLDTYSLNIASTTTASLPDGKVAFINSLDPQSTLEIRERNGSLVSNCTIGMSRPAHMCFTANGSLVIVGGTKICCIRPDCTTVWTQLFDWACFTAAVETRDGGVVVVGSTEEFGFGGEDIVLLKFLSDGTRVW
jgi:hypothetical protein